MQHEILVADNGDEKLSTMALAQDLGARYVHVPCTGLSRARNAAVCATTAEILAFIDDDAIPDKGWVSKLTEPFDDPQVMAVAGRILPIDPDTECSRVWNEIRGDRTESVVVDRSTADWFERTNFGGVGDGGNMALRRDAFSVWPGFDERLGRGASIDGMEEHFAFFTLVERGYRVAFTPEARVFHPSPSTMNALRERYVRDITASTAFMTLLFFEFPAYRSLLLKFALRNLKGSKRDWKKHRGKAIEIVSRWRRLGAMLRGPSLYLKMKIRGA